MVASYAVGIGISALPYSEGTLRGSFVFHDDIAMAHFAASVAVSGCLSPRMFIHLMQARDDQLFDPNCDLPSLQIVSFAGSEVSLLPLPLFPPPILSSFKQSLSQSQDSANNNAIV